MAHLAALRAHAGSLPVGVTVFVEGEEEIGSRLARRPSSSGTATSCAPTPSSWPTPTNWAIGEPALTTTLRGLIRVVVTVTTLDHGVHSGMFGGAVPDAITALVRLLATLHDDDGDVAVAGLKSGDGRRPRLRRGAAARGVRACSTASRSSAPARCSTGMWTKPTADGHRHRRAVRRASRPTPSCPRASAKVSIRLAPDEVPAGRVCRGAARTSRRTLPWGAKVEVHLDDQGAGFDADADGPVYDQARAAFTDAWGVEPVDIGVGGSIPFVARVRREVPAGGDPRHRRGGPRHPRPRRQRVAAPRRVREGLRRRGVLLARLGATATRLTGPARFERMAAADQGLRRAVLRTGHPVHQRPHHGRRLGAVAGGARPVPAGRRAGLPLGQPGHHRATAARARGRHLDGAVRADPRPGQLDLRPRPGRCGPGAGHPAAQGRLRARQPGYPRGITVPAIVDVPTGQVVTNDFAQITLDFSTQWTRVPPRGRARPLPGGAARRDGRGDKRVYTEVNNGVYRCGFAGTRRPTTRRTSGCSTALDWLEERLADPALPHGRHDHRGGRAAVHHAGAVRPGLPRPLQVQPLQAQRDAGAVGLRAGPLPDAGFRRHHRLRPDQAALLRRPPGHQPDRDRPRRPRPARLAHAPRPRALGGRPFGDGTPPGPVHDSERVPEEHQP